MANASRTPDWQRALVLLTGTVIGVTIVIALYWAQVVFIPIALAVFFTFLLNPLVKALQSRGFGRTPAILTVVLLTALTFAGMGWLIGRQVTGLLTELPNYTANIVEKVKTLRAIGGGQSTERLARMIEEVSAEIARKPPSDSSAAVAVPVPDTATTEDASPDSAQPVVVTADRSEWMPQMPTQLEGLLNIVGSFALALVLVVFMLLERENLRNRFISLMGKGRITLTTKVVDEAGHRISRYLVVQALINGSYGLVLSAVLLLLGVDYALLWGFLAATLRYIPYLGAWLAAIFPLTMTLAIFDSWWPLLVLIAVFIVMELVTNNVVEPWLYGHTMGVSSVALIVAAAFFALLWGPLGMVLSAPMTVCLVVLGKYIPQLEFLDILLSDQPALDADVSFYQRLLARDQDEATELVLSEAKASTTEEIYDGLLIPALNAVKRDRQLDELTDADERFVLHATREILEDVGEKWGTIPPTKADATATEDSPLLQIPVLGCPARDEADRLGLEMMKQLLDPARWDMEITSPEMLASEVVARAIAEKIPVVCIGALPPGGLAHIRYLCKRLRASSPKIKIVVGRWGLQDDPEQKQEQLRESGADLMLTTLQDTRDQLDAWHPVFTQEVSARSSEGPNRQSNPVAPPHIALTPRPLGENRAESVLEGDGALARSASRDASPSP